MSELSITETWIALITLKGNKERCISHTLSETVASQRAKTQPWKDLSSTKINQLAVWLNSNKFWDIPITFPASFRLSLSKKAILLQVWYLLILSSCAWNLRQRMGAESGHTNKVGTVAVARQCIGEITTVGSHRDFVKMSNAKYTAANTLLHTHSKLYYINQSYCNSCSQCPRVTWGNHPIAHPTAHPTQEGKLSPARLKSARVMSSQDSFNIFV